jgi:protein phosphatase
LLCSDGLSGQVTDEELGAILQCLDPEEAVSTLVDLANFRGGPDNITAIVARIDGEIPAHGDFASLQVNRANGGGRQIAQLLSIGACIGMLGYFLAHRNWTAAAVSGVALVAAVVAALTFRPRAAAGVAPAQSIGGPYGNGPHRKVHCGPNGRITALLGEIAATLRDLPNNELTSWAGTIQWQPFEIARAEAAEAAKKEDFKTAICKYCQAIRYVMKQVREHRPTVDAHDAF